MTIFEATFEMKSTGTEITLSYPLPEASICDDDADLWAMAAASAFDALKGFAIKHFKADSFITKNFMREFELIRIEKIAS